MTFLSLSALTDNELLQRAYNDRVGCTPLVLELATRLEHALDELQRPARKLEDIVQLQLRLQEDRREERRRDDA